MRFGEPAKTPWMGLLGVAVAAGLGFGTSAAGQDLACADCHDVDPAAVAASLHGFLECLDCHAGAAEVPHADDVASPACADCHETEVVEFQSGVHAEKNAAAILHGESGDGPGAWVAGCLACHGEAHTLVGRGDPASPVHPQRLAATCGTCHANPEMASHFALGVVQPVEAYLASVHARSVAGGDGGADCGSCHGAHAIFPAADPRSTVHHARVATTCGACHGEIAAAFAASVHGQALARGVREAPACTDCHGEHRILAAADPDSPVYPTNIPKLTCGRCHGDLRLATKFGLDADRLPTFEDSFHGLTLRSGGASVAHCGSCHGVHDILPSSDPGSRVSKENLAATCGTCHPGAGSRFAIGTVHVVDTERDQGAVYWVRWFYLWVIYLAVGGMVLHNALDLYRKARNPAAWAPRSPRAPQAAGRVRMLPGFRIAHAALASSFLVLVYTGFALKYPEAWWAQPLLRWEEGFGLRGLLHRAAAVVLLAAGAFHAVHVIVDRRARACFKELVRPRWADVHELRERILWMIGRRPSPPATPWVGYPEKAEYLALIWGTLLMAVTGFLLWFENLALAWAPKWVTDVATTIHFYEGVLATLAILVWHFYFVIFDPVVYPMDTAWLTGRSVAGRVQEREAGEGHAGDR